MKTAYIAYFLIGSSTFAYIITQFTTLANHMAYMVLGK